MKRRQFFATLAGLPFVGKFIQAKPVAKLSGSWGFIPVTQELLDDAVIGPEDVFRSEAWISYVVRKDGTHVAIGSDGTVVQSSNGMNWTERRHSEFTSS